METTELGNNEWLSSLFEIRSRWVPAYVKHVFAAGMSSSQRSESGHSFLKKYVDRKNSLTDFVSRFNRVLVHQRHGELAANHIDLTQMLKVTTALMMENQMVQIYTKKIFLLFQNELVQSNSYICFKRSSFDEAKVYAVQHFESGRTSDRTRQVNYFLSTDYISCSCQIFDFEGYPCRHMLCCMKKTNAALAEEIYSSHSMLSYAASDLVDKGSLTDARSTFLLSEFQSLCIHVKDIDTGGEVSMRRNRNKSVEETRVVCDPNPVRAKGCEKRLKSGKEKALFQSNRQCRACGTSGHDRRTCPTLQNSLDNTNQPQYLQDPSDQQYHAPDPQ
ncbi:Protein FAR1-RELATED SEQUENCE 5 [Abeliophyllum distichum]|uniref:Protein FAR1-RELATED SEQUENCE n=1 Tax=Abeliophyllum distichum TaxID=126358 RepID=A0ABD1UL95_9LAMI